MTRRSKAALAVTALAAVVCACRDRAPTAQAEPLWVPPPVAVAIDASVRFTGTQFVIENRGVALWRDIEISVGREDDPPAFRCRADAILDDRSVTIGALNFERPDGTRLSPFRIQPDRWAVTATLPDGRRGFAEGSFERGARPRR